MNLWIYVVLGIALAIVYKAYQVHKAKKMAKQLEEQMKNDNIQVKK